MPTKTIWSRRRRRTSLSPTPAVSTTGK
ncbi:MAG: hypothetical protein HY997_12595 [Mycolicibacterium neoaurum]|nr:hypothetical protein [Mycolicibacterium neoaurum]